MPPSDPRREEVRSLYEAGALKLKEISQRTGVSVGTISTWANRHGWTGRPRRSPVKRKRPKMSSLVDRMYQILIHTLEQMETRMSDDGKPAGENPERDMRALSNAVRSIEKLKEIEPEQSKRDGSAKGRFPLTPDEEDRLRDEIVERLLKLRERRSNQAGGQ